MKKIDACAVIIVDDTGTILVWELGAERLLGFAAHEVVGRAVDTIIPPEYRDEHWSGFRSAMTSGVAKYDGQVMELPVLRKDGQVVVFSVQLSFIRNSRRNPIGAMAILEPKEDGAVVQD